MRNAAKPILPKILILSSAEEAETSMLNDNFVKSLNQRLSMQCQVEWHNYHNICLEFHTGHVEAFLLADGTPLKNFAAVYFKSYFRFHEQAAAIAEYLREHNVLFVGEELKSYIPSTKLTQLVRMSRANLPIPKTVYMSTSLYRNNYALLKRKLGSPFIFKAIDGSTGEDNYLIHSAEQLKNALGSSIKAHFIAQSFIANDGDLRVLVVGKEPRLVIDRRRKDASTSHLNNTSQGATARLISIEDVDQKLLQLSIKAADVMKREIAGVDIILEKHTGTPYVLEVNASPQIASGAFEEEKLMIYENYFKDLLAKQNHTEKTLGVIGRAEYLQILGLVAKPVPARIDTGAKTSAIWASNIVESAGSLSFTLFDKGSEWYTGQPVTTKDYSKIAVANSSGYVEQRYAVKLLVVLKNRKIRATFTLANRALQVYPVLVGRNILRGKFLVNAKTGKPLVTREKVRELEKQAVIGNTTRKKSL